jgi:benzoate membrane transport protein
MNDASANIRSPDPAARSFWRDIEGVHVANALVGVVFAASGPVAVILAVGARGGLTETDLASWIFGAFFINGLITIAYSWWYRQPLAFFWTIPGTVLVGPTLAHAPFAEVIGAFLVAGFIMLVMGLARLVRPAMAAVPMPIVMAMVAGVFLQFGLDWVRAFKADALLAGAMTAIYFFLSAFPRLARRVPPLLAALGAGLGLSWMMGTFAPHLEASAVIASPQLYAPIFRSAVLVELVVPLIITVLVVQNGQGVATLTAAGHVPPVNSIAAACGAGSIAAAFVGTVSTCLTGPTNAIITGSGRREGHYTAGIMVGALAILFGAFSPLFTRLMLAAPAAFIATLAGLAMLNVLRASFAMAFNNKHGIGALITFLVTVAGMPILNIGAPFWGLVIGYVASRIAEPADFKSAA